MTERIIACTNCQWQGDINDVVWGDDHSQYCPKCHHEVINIRDLRDIRIEQKLDKIISLLGDRTVVKNDKQEKYNIVECENWYEIRNQNGDVVGITQKDPRILGE